METRVVGGVRLSYSEHGSGVPLIALHGAGVDHGDIESALEAVLPDNGYRRIYPDLPGMGRSSSEGIPDNSGVVSVLGDFIDEISDEPVLLVGHSYGAYLVRGLAAARPELLRGVALLCPFAGDSADLPTHRAVRQDDDAYADLEPAEHDGFDGYFVVRTRALARRYRDRIAPGVDLVDVPALERIFAEWSIDLTAEMFSAPTLLVAGRDDATAGYTHAIDLVKRYPRGTLAIIDDAGHALMHEKPELVGALLGDWLNRATQERP